MATQPAVVIVGGSPAGTAAPTAGSGAGLLLGLGLVAGAAVLLAQPNVVPATEAAYWYAVGETIPQARARAINHLKALEKSATGNLKTQIQQDITALSKLPSSSSSG